MDFVTAIITPIVESLLVPVKKHLGFWVSSTKHVKEMGERMEQLNVTAKDVREKEEATAAKSQMVPQQASKWLKDVEKLNKEAQSVAPTGCLNVASRYKAGKWSCDILKKIDDLKTRKSEIEWTDEQIPLGMVGSSSTHVPVHDADGHGTHNNFASRDSIFKAALKALQPDNETHKMIALCGMGGVGKTTMMEHLKKAVQDSKMYDWVVKVVLGEDTNPISIQQDIAEKLGGALTETAVDARADRLQKMFEGASQDGKKILVIMDDLWKHVELKNFGLTCPLPYGFKLLFTSRFRNVCTQMGVNTKSILDVRVLNDAEAKTLFFEIVEQDGDDLELHKIGEAIVKKCGGLPIAIKTIASILKGEIKEAWEAALSRLQNHDLQDLGGIVQTVFEMSYKSLKKDLDKAIFLLSGLFPDDHDIPTEDLLRYGWGLDFFKDVKNLATARRDTKISVSNLIRANLLMESDRTGCVKMHDLTREFVLSNFSKVKQASVLNHENMPVQRLTEDGNDSYERILIKCEGMSQFPEDFHYPNLSLLMLMDGDKGLKFRKDFFDKMRKLEVVSYERMHTPLLPVMLQYSTNLRTLCFHSCSLIDDISFLGSLKNLETLSFADCKIRKLPSTIGKLKRLKLLDVSGCASLTIDDGVLENLVRLEDLYMKVFQNKAVRFTEANCDELKILSTRLSTLELEFFENKAQPKNVSFKQLKRFRISIGCNLNNPEDYSFKNTLFLVANRYELLDCKISELFEKTEYLRLQVTDMTCIQDVSALHLSQHSFCNLRNLVVSKCLDLTYLFTVPMANGLKKLEVLSIFECPKLVSLCDAADNVVELPKLVELILDGLPNFTSIYPDNNNASAMTSFLNKEVVIPKLEKLVISMMENLKQIWPRQITATNDKNKVSMLKKIEVKKCESLENLFPRNPLPLLSHLQELEVEACSSIEVLFNIEVNNNASSMPSFFNKEVAIPKLEKLDISKMKNLKQIWPCQITATGDKNKVSMLREIKVKKCESLENLFPRNPLPLLSHLQELEVKECGSIEVLFNIDMERVCEMEEESISKSSMLRRIEVNRLGKLRELWRINEGVNNNSQTVVINSFKGVERIDIKDCKRFRNIFTPTTTNFDLGGVTWYISETTGQDLEEIVGNNNKLVECSQQAIVMFKGESSTSKDESSSTYASHILHTCHNLQDLLLANDPRVKVVFEMDAPSPSPSPSQSPILSSRSELATIRDHTQQQPPHDDDLLPLLLPAHHHLKSIQLWSLKEMSHVWKCSNWNKFSIPPPHHHPLKLEFPFHNLTSISLWGCHKVKYLFSPLMTKFLSNLKTIEIQYCEGMEEVISRRDDEIIMCVASTSSHTTNTTLYFPHLDTLKLHYLPCLQHIDDEILGCGDEDEGVVMGAGASSYWSLCQYPKRIHVQDCDVLSSVIPWYAAGQMKKLESLDIYYCSSITEVFESSPPPPPPPALTKNITTRHHHHHVPQLSNLKYVEIEGCDLLPHVFTFSTLETLNQLKELKVSNCKALTQVINTPVKQEEEEEDEINGKASSSSSSSSKGAGVGVGRVVVVFPHLETLELEDLPKLEGFFLGINNNIHFRWPSLEDLTIKNCPQMKVFASAGHLETPKLKYIQTDYGKHALGESGLNFHSTNHQHAHHHHHQTALFSSSDASMISKGMLWSFHNLIEIDISLEGDDEKIIPSTALLQLEKLEKVYFWRCSKVKEVFEVESSEGTNCESQTVVKIPNLREVELDSMKSLEYIWKSNQWMVLEFPNLTTMSICDCPKLEYVFTCSMAGSLLQLQHLRISTCKNMEVIIKEEGGGGDAKVNEIVLLPHLKSINLEWLSNLKGFCLGNEAFSWPLLDILEINHCPTITVFTKGHLDTPKLKVVDISFGMCYVSEDLNSLIKTKQEEGYEF